MTTRTRMLVVGVIVPLTIAAAGIIATLVALPTLPDPVAIHWGPSGGADGFGPPIVFPILVAGVVLGYSALCFSVARADGPTTTNQRIVLAIAPFLATIITVIGAGSLVIQSGLADAHDAPSVLPLVAIASVTAVLLGIISLMALPRSEAHDDPESARVLTVELAANERAVWMQRVGPAPALVAFLIGVALVVIVGGGLLLWLRAPLPSLVLYLGVLAVIGVLVAATLAWRVSVDARGFAARSVLGMPVFRIPLSQVERAVSVEVDPVRDFGGWGIRWGSGRSMGLILRRGEAIKVLRRDGSALVVTVAHSERGAALLNSLHERAR